MRMRVFARIAATIGLALMPVEALAHVVVTPGQVNIGQELVFNFSVPNEQSTAVTSVKLNIPKGVTDVVPTAKQGWTIQMDTSGSGENQAVTAITWTGSIPVGQRDDLSFGATAPANAGDLDWKAYQSYSDGTVVHWDQTPNGKSDDSVGNAGPYSVTHVANDLNAKSNGPSKDTTALVLSIAALALSVVGLARRR